MPAGLTAPSTERVAKYLAKHPDTTTADIAKALHLGRPTVTKGLVALEGAGQAERRKGGRTGTRVEPDTWRLVNSDATVDAPSEPSLAAATVDSDSPEVAPEPVADDEPDGPDELEASDSSDEADEPSDSEPEPADTPTGEGGDQHGSEASVDDPPQPKTASSNGSKQRLRPGELREAVVAHLKEHPDIEVTAGDVARVLSRSAGAVHNVLQKLITEGTVTLASPKPRRYKAIPPA